jgi:hypothetical protein
MGSTGSYWVQLPVPRTYKAKYLKLRQLIMDRYEATKDLERYRERKEELMNLRVLINVMERKSDKENPWDMTKK